MSPRTQRAGASALLVGTIGVCIASIPGLVDAWSVENEGAWAFPGFGLVGSVVFALAGGLLAFKRPENPVGWLFAAVGAAFAIITAGEIYAVTPLIKGNDGGIRYQVAWLTAWGWVIFLGLIAFSVLLFPSGHLPSRRWLPAARLMAAGFVLGCIAFAVAPGPLNNMPARITNRYGLPPGPAAEMFVNAGMVAFLAALVGAAAGAIHRYRSSHGLQKQQMKLFALAAAGMAVSMALVVIAVLFAPRFMDVVELLSSFAMMSIPVAMTVAILRYRLYDIDLVINRALVYAALSGVLAIVYLGTVVLLQQVLSPVTVDSDAAVAASTLAVAALFRPLRSRIQTFIDRRFYRSKYDAADTLAEFAGRLRDQVDLDALRTELLVAAASTFQPAHASLWLREAARK